MRELFSILFSLLKKLFSRLFLQRNKSVKLNMLCQLYLLFFFFVLIRLKIVFIYVLLCCMFRFICPILHNYIRNMSKVFEV